MGKKIYYYLSFFSAGVFQILLGSSASTPASVYDLTANGRLAANLMADRKLATWINEERRNAPALDVKRCAEDIEDHKGKKLILSSKN
jgi:hypothetical protein